MPNAEGSPQIGRFDAVLETAVGESAALAMRAMHGADKLMLQAAAAALMPVDRRRLEDAAAALRACRSGVEAAFPAALREEISGKYASPAASAVTFDSLELMGEDQVDDTVEFVRGQQLVKAAVEQDLVLLNALVSAAQGHERVRATANPLRPEIWVRALHRSIGAAKAPLPMRALLMFHASQALGPELAILYRQLCERLRQEGVTAAAYRVSALEQAAARGQTQLTLRDLKRLLASVVRGAEAPQGHTSSGATQTMGGMTMPAAMEALQDMKRVDDVVRRMQERWRQGVWQAETVSAQDGSGVAGSSYTPIQTLAREVVRIMVANITADSRLLTDVQQAVRELEPALLRLVVQDQRFFSDHQHPARQLLDEVTRRSQAWPNRKARGFDEFLRPLKEIVQVLAQMPLEDAEPFEYALHTLRQAWAESEERMRRPQATMARILLKADERNHLAAELAARLRERHDVAGAPPEARRFLLGPWCQAMAAARLVAPEGVADPGGYGAAVSDLVWISQPRLAAQDPARLATLGTALRKTFSTGLAAIGYSKEEAGKFFDYLDEVQARAARGETDAPPPDRQGAAGEDDRAAADLADGVPWLAPNEVSDPELLRTPALADDFQPTERAGAAAARAPGDSFDVGQLQPGHFVEVMVRGHWTRWQLTWASPHGLLYMFTDAEGRPESMTRQIVEKLVALGAMRPLPSQSLVDGALDALAREALQNSARLPK